HHVAARDAQVSDSFTDTDVANSKRLARQHGQDLHFTTERAWFAYDGKRWVCDEKGICVQALAKKTALSIFDEIKLSADQKTMIAHAKRSQSKNAIDSMIWLARSEMGIPISLTDFDTDRKLLNVANGTVNLESGALQDHRREDLMSNIANVSYDNEAECELWDAFVWRITDQNEELYKYLRRFVGYLLGGDTSDQSLHFLYGAGANGKSVFCEVLMRLLGDYAVSVSPEMIMARRYSGIPNDVARLRGVRVAFMNETSQGSKFDEAKLKDLTGGDTLSARFLHHEFFEFSPTHKLVIRGNHKPTISGNDEGIWRRLRLVPFSVSIPIEEQDRTLLWKLEQELPGILQWALRGYREWRERGLQPPEIITAAVSEYRAESDTLGRFIEEHCEKRANAQVKSSVFFTRYQEFCHTAGERWMASKDLPHEMEKRGFRRKRTKACSVFEGLELNNFTEAWDRSV
ncbi:MAG: phage/plasmid primase, P4 family, partial [Acidobacteriota bacterium]|nr:phage/plasmid primase, P4 family [Acidobacteriota bacterium]